ncbi:nucleolar complex protein 14 [Trapelia coarctata]|nr:nucleolar complex protein 14 [Trapelia coarctata]
MPPSQLKRLKSSLRENGVTGPQKSKKQKKQASKSGLLKEKRVQRDAALHGIREQFNPFEVKIAPGKIKYEFANAGVTASNGVLGRPGVTKGLGEETRRKTLLVEMQRRKKVGGILDRRFGEDDPTMTPEEKAMERFVKEKQRGGQKGSMFDLEDEMDAGEPLTHLGQSLSFDKGKVVDDFDATGLNLSDAGDTDEEGELRSRKRRRLSDSEDQDEDADASEKPKTKQEVMKEVIAKSKFHKYERQKAKEDDDDLRAQLDEGLKDIYALLRNTPAQSKALPPVALNVAAPEIKMNPDRAALLNGKDRSQADKEYDERLRQMAFDARSKPTVRTKTQEEKLEEEAKRLKDLEEKRLARMRGEEVDSDAEKDEKTAELQGDEDFGEKDENPTGLGPGIVAHAPKAELDVEDEDDFVIDYDLIASGSEAELTEDDEDSAEASVDGESDEEEKEFVQGLLDGQDQGREGFGSSNPASQIFTDNDVPSELAFTYPCPQTHDELLQITKNVSVQSVPTIVQRIRALYHPKLAGENKAKLGVFAAVLVDHLSYLANQPEHPPFTVLETLIRHVHSLAKTFLDEVGRAFRTHLKAIQDERPTSLTPGDLVLFTAIASIFPTSDHFHSVVTPSILSMARYLGQNIPHSLSDLLRGTYLGTLCLQYQRLSKRYIPELVNHSLNALSLLAPSKPKKSFGFYPVHEGEASLRIRSTGNNTKAEAGKLKFWDLEHVDGKQAEADERLKLALLETNTTLIDRMAEIWMGKSAFYEIFDPFHEALQHLLSKACYSTLPHSTIPNQMKLRTTSTKLDRLLHQATLNRRPLLLHNHRPLAIKTSIPKFEDSYNPTKHYDPDRERAELGKLKAEHKRERKGALRELRKDANFIARESLREKKERDAAYEKKYKRLVAEIQGEEGKEANVYEREKRLRKGRKGR